MSASSSLVPLRYTVPRSRDGWEISEETVPESELHDLVLDMLKAILVAWVARTGLSAHVARNRAIRWDPSRPRVGVDPDVCIITPRTPEGDDLQSVMLWRAGHTPPLLAVEVVSANHPTKDYVIGPEKYAASGTRELWVFDPTLAGPRVGGGPFRLQVWTRGDDGGFERVYAGDGPARSSALAAWVIIVEDGMRLRIADDERGAALWPTPEELALARVRELEEELRRR